MKYEQQHLVVASSWSSSASFPPLSLARGGTCRLVALDMSVFEELGVCPELIRVADEQGWLLPTPVQAEAVPLILGGGDVLAAAETGSGKTGAFGVPILQIVHESLRDAAATSARAAAASDGAASSASSAADARMSVEDRNALFAVAPDGRLVQARGEKQWAGGRADVGVVAGKHYYEAEVMDDGLVRIGWSTSAGSLEGLGTDAQSFGFGGTGKKSHAKAFENYGEPYAKGDVVGCLLDCDEGTIAFTKNGADLGGVAFRVPKNLAGRALFPAVCLKNAECRLRFGGETDGKGFAHAPPPGYAGVSAAKPGEWVRGTGDGARGGGRAGAGAGAGASVRSSRTPLALVLEPARDLAEQTHAHFETFSAHLTHPRVTSGLFVGGVDAKSQTETLRGGCDVAVGTPGRVLDLVESGALNLSGVRFFVLDEADRLLDAGNQGDILRLFARMPRSGPGFKSLQVLLFSATLHSPEISKLATTLCREPTWVDLKGKEHVPDTVHHAVYVVDPGSENPAALVPAAPVDNMHDESGGGGPDGGARGASSLATKRLKPHVVRRVADALKMDQCLIFCRTNFDCDNLEAFLNACGGGGVFRGKRESGPQHAYSCAVLGGARSMDERRRNLRAFKEGDVRFLICTDVAARGIDVRGLPYVINATLPEKSEDYVHRVGRVGRADVMGLAVSVVSSAPEKVWYCQKKGYKPWFKPSREDRTAHSAWIDEAELLRGVEKRLGAPVARLGADFSLPAELAAKLRGGGGDGGAGVYGRARGDGTCEEMAAHLAAYAPAVRRLAELEVASQVSFWNLKRKFADVDE